MRYTEMVFGFMTTVNTRIKRKENAGKLAEQENLISSIASHNENAATRSKVVKPGQLWACGFMKFPALLRFRLSRSLISCKYSYLFPEDE